jgi:uncharacterized protein (TIGR00369 family)
MTAPPTPSAQAHLRAAVQGVLDVPMHVALGIALVDPERPEAGITMPVTGMAINNTGVLHGGLVPCLLDIAAYLALLPQLAEGTSAVTINATASLLRAVPAGEIVRFTGTVDRVGYAAAFCSAEGHHGDRTVATGQLVKSVVRPR